jgi:hypothetical protein
MQRNLLTIAKRADALLKGSIADFPRLTKRALGIRQRPIQQSLQSPSAPHAGLIERLKR